MENNFILPKTETSLNKIINQVSSFFELVQFLMLLSFLIYSLLRFLLFPGLLVLNICLSVISAILLTVNQIKNHTKVKIHPLVLFSLVSLKRIFCLTVELLIFSNLVKLKSGFQEINIIFAILCTAGILLNICGDIFNATIPKWTKEILDSFKEDIDISGLTFRSLDQIKEAVSNNEELKQKAIGSALSAGKALFIGGIKKLFN